MINSMATHDILDGRVYFYIGEHIVHVRRLDDLARIATLYGTSVDALIKFILRNLDDGLSPEEFGLEPNETTSCNHLLTDS